MARTVNLNNLGAEIMKITKEYADEVKNKTEAAVMKTAFHAEEQLHTAGDFGGSGDYKRGWTVTFDRTRLGMEATVYNKLYMLTHLLESGHAKWLWGHKQEGERVDAIPHIEQVNEEAQKMLEEEIKRSLG